MNKEFKILIAALVFTIWICVFINIDGTVTLQGVVAAAITSWITLVVLYAFLSFFDKSYEGKRRTVKWLMEERENKHREMLFKMQYSSFPDALREIDKMIKKYPHLKLHRYVPFRAWYKHYQGGYLKEPEFYAKLLEAGMTPLEEDPYYFPDAPDWEQFDRDRSYYYHDDDDDDDYDNDEYDDEYDDEYYDDDYFDDEYETKRRRRSLKDAAEEGLYTGIGLGIASDIFDDSSHFGGE